VWIAAGGMERIFGGDGGRREVSQWKVAASNLFKSGMTTISSLTAASTGLPNGTMIAVGEYRVQIVKLLAEGGFAFVYLVKDAQSDLPFALKRLLVSDRDDLNKVKEEIAFMVRVRVLSQITPPHLL
jgi:serine/threonine protein kinase